MLRFVAKLLIFLSPLLLLLGLVEHRLTQIPSGYKTKRIYLERNLDKAQVIITGSSHSYYGIKPQMLGVPAFSIACPSQDLYYDTRILLKYLPRAKSLKLVIIPVSYFSFNGLLEDSAETWRTAYYYRFWDIPRTSWRPRIEDYSLIALYGIPQTRSFLWNGVPTTVQLHFNESGGSEDVREVNPASVIYARATIERHSSNFSRRNVAQDRQYLDELLAALHERGITAVIITTPCFHSYYENVKPEIYDVMQETIKNLSWKYGLEYHNYLTDSRFTIEDFADSDHLSTAGAEKFSQILRDEVVKEYVK